MDNEKLLEARFALLHEESKLLDLRSLIRDIDQFEDDYVELCWRYNELSDLFWFDDTSLMFSVAKLASRHHAAVLAKYLEFEEMESIYNDSL